MKLADIKVGMRVALMNDDGTVNRFTDVVSFDGRVVLIKFGQGLGRFNPVCLRRVRTVKKKREEIWVTRGDLNILDQCISASKEGDTVHEAAITRIRTTKYDVRFIRARNQDPK